MYEYAFMLASLESFFNKRVNCQHCISKYYGTARHKMIEVTQKQMGCFNNKRLNKLENICYHGCIGNFKDEGVDYLMALFLNYERGMLPYNMSYSEHPNKLIEIFNVIENFKNKHLEKKQKRKKTKDKLNSRVVYG